MDENHEDDQNFHDDQQTIVLSFDTQSVHRRPKQDSPHHMAYRHSLDEASISSDSTTLASSSAKKRRSIFARSMKSIRTKVNNTKGISRDLCSFDNVLKAFDMDLADDPNQLEVNCPLIRINISGSIFETYPSTFESHPDTLLGCPIKRQPFVRKVRDGSRELFFDRCRRSFTAIFNYYQTDNIQRPDCVSLAKFAEELNFFQIESEAIRRLFLQEKAIQFFKSSHKAQPDGTGISRGRSTKKKLWELINVPTSSKWAMGVFTGRIIMHLYMLLVFLLTPQIVDKASIVFLYSSEIICNAIIFVDVCLHWYSSPNRRKYMRSYFTVVDMLSIASCIFLLVLTMRFKVLSQIERNALNAAMKTLQLFRVLQLFRYSRSNVTDALGRALRNSSVEIISIFFVIVILSVFFGTLFYFTEHTSPLINPHHTAAAAALTTMNPETPTTTSSRPVATSPQMIETIWDGIWLALITMTTVGYGDKYPHTFAGRAVAVICTCLGQAIICMIIPIMSNLYQQYYEGRVQEDQLIGTIEQAFGKVVETDGDSPIQKGNSQSSEDY